MSTTDLGFWLDADPQTLRRDWGSVLGAGEQPHGRTDDGVRDASARGIWSLLAEPGDAVAGRLIAELGAVSALRVAVGDPVLRGKEIGDAVARWRPRAGAAAIEGMFRLARGAGLRLVIPGDAAWPDGLGDLGPHAPHALWLRGLDPLALTGRRRVAVIGARAASAYGERVAIDLCAELAARGVTVVSGAAYGIDGAAHRAALHAGGRSVAVLAGGADRPYPAGHSDLISRVAQGGAVIAEVAPGTAPTKWRFLQRNRMIAAIADATVVVEAGWRSGSLNTAGHAAALGRPLGAVPGPVTSATSAGCHRLLRDYAATCVTSASDVLELLGDLESSAPGSPAGAGRPTDDATRVLDALSVRASRSVGDIAKRAGTSPDETEALLGLLALERIAVTQEGGWRRAPTGRAGN